MFKDEFRRKLERDTENEILIEIAQQLAYNEKVVSDINKNTTGDDEVYQDDMINLAIHMANDYINQESPVEDTRDYFNTNMGSIANAYFANRLNEIEYKETTAVNPTQLLAQNIYKMAVDNEILPALVEKEPNIEKEIYDKIKEDLYDDGCHTWCKASETFINKAREYDVIPANVVSIKMEKLGDYNYNPLVSGQ